MHIDPLVLDRQCLSAVIESEPDLKIVESTASISEAIERIMVAKPDIVLSDFQFADSDMIHMIATIRKKGLLTKIVVFSNDFHLYHATEALCGGVFGYLSKKDPIEHLISSIRQINRGYLVISSRAKTSEKFYTFDEKSRITSEREVSRWKYLLTTQEVQVLECAACGMTVNETKKIVCKSYSAIKNIKKSIFSKLNVSNSPAAVYAAMKNGILK